MIEYLIAVGSNIEPRYNYIKNSIKLLSEQVTIAKVASLYTTKPVGPAENNFINTALLCTSQISPIEMMAALLKIEAALKRQRLQKWGDRTIDLDMIMARNQEGSNLSISHPTLKLPHPKAHQRDFVMVPVLEIASHWVMAERYHSAWLSESNIVSKEPFSERIEIIF